MPDLALLTEAYQATLEHHRSAKSEYDSSVWGDGPDAEFVEELAEDLERAKRELEVAWLEQQITAS